MKTLTPIVLIIAALGLFFGFTNTEYKKIDALKKEQAEYKTLIVKSDQLKAKKEGLQNKYKNISKENVSNLNKLLPDTIDNIRLIIDITRIASNRGLLLQNISVQEDVVGSGKQKNAADIESKSYGSIKISFLVTASYEAFLTFLTDLEESLRLVDIIDLNISTGKQGVNTYNISMQTYWLR